MKHNAALVRRKGGEEVEASNQLITLDDNVFIVVELVSEEPSQSVTLKLVTLPDRLVSWLGEEDPCLLVWSIGEMLDGLACQDAGDLLFRNREALLIAIQAIITVPMKPVQAEEIVFAAVCDSADVLQIAFGNRAFLCQCFLAEEEALTAAMLFVIGPQGDVAVVVVEGNEDRVFIDAHSDLLSY